MSQALSPSNRCPADISGIQQRSPLVCKTKFPNRQVRARRYYESLKLLVCDRLVGGSSQNLYHLIPESVSLNGLNIEALLFPAVQFHNLWIGASRLVICNLAYIIEPGLSQQFLGKLVSE